MKKKLIEVALPLEKRYGTRAKPSARIPVFSVARHGPASSGPSCACIEGFDEAAGRYRGLQVGRHNSVTFPTT